MKKPLYERLNISQHMFLDKELNIKIEEREYSREELDEIEDKVANYMQENASFYPAADETALRCEGILDIINE